MKDNVCATREIMKRIKERFAASGLSPSRRIEILNLLLDLGQWLKALKNQG